MKVLLDENVPRQLARQLTGHQAATVYDSGLEGVKNGALLKKVEAGGFQSFVTGDKQMQHQQRLDGRPFSVILLSATNWKLISQKVAVINDAIERCRPGTIMKVDCGAFVARRFRKPEEPSV